MTRIGFIVIATLVLVLAGCEQLARLRSPQVDTPVAYGPETERQIEVAAQRYSALLLAMDASAVSNMYAPDGIMEKQSGPLVGRSAIRDALANTGGVRVMSMELITSYMSYNGPAVVQTGDFKQSAKLPNGKLVEAAGRFEATWVHSDSGEWWIKRMVTRPNAAKPTGT